MVAALALGLAAFFAFRPGSAVVKQGAAVTRLELNLPQDLESYAAIHTMALSPDGTRLAFIGIRSGTRHLHPPTGPVRGRSTPRYRIASRPASFSADGTSIGVVTASGVLRTVSLADGVVTTVTDRAGTQSGEAWTSDGSIVFGRGDTLWRVARTGGVRRSWSNSMPPSTSRGDLSECHPGRQQDPLCGDGERSFAHRRPRHGHG